MASQLDPEWFRVAALKPRLRSQVSLHRHRYRGEVWHVAQDAVTGKFHRFAPAAWRVIGLMDGARTLDDIWHRATTHMGDDAPTQREMLRLLHQLHVAELLRTDVVSDSAELSERRGRARRTRVLQTLKTPLAIRVPLIDPERFLAATAGVGAALFSRLGFAIWLGLMLLGAVVLLSHWQPLTQNLTDTLLSPQNLLVLWLLFPVTKIAHEFGHAWAVKRWGGEVHEMGVMLLVFTPVPYVDASQSSAFHDKWRRAVVGLAGMLVELAIAALALCLWALIEPGIVRTACYNVVLIAGISTVLFNGNPLLRFDAYYVLADLAEIPNLAGRANQYVFYLVQRYAFGLRDAESPAHRPDERKWLLGYAIGSFVFRMFLYVSIMLFVGAHYFLIGVAIALWSLWNMFGAPLLKGARFVLTSARVARRRGRAVLVSSGGIAAVVILLTLVPLPYATLAEGIVWVPDDALVRADTAGVVTEARHPGPVTAGATVATLTDPLLDVEAAVHRAELAAFDARVDFFEFSEPAEANIAREQREAARAVLARTNERRAGLAVAAPADGQLVYAGGSAPLGRFVARGERLGYVLTAEPPRVKAVIDQSALDAVRHRTRAVRVRLAQRIGETRRATVTRITPAGSTVLPSPALGSAGGGAIAIDPRDDERLTTLAPVFELDLVLPDGAPVAAVGSRVHIRFDHGAEPLAYRWYRDLRRLFLDYFDV